MWDLPGSRSNPCLLGQQADSLPLSHQGSPKGVLLTSVSWSWLCLGRTADCTHLCIQRCQTESINTTDICKHHQLAPHPEPAVKPLPAHRASNWPLNPPCGANQWSSFPLQNSLTNALVPPRLPAVPIRETACFPRGNYPCPKPVHAKIICYSNHRIR